MSDQHLKILFPDLNELKPIEYYESLYPKRQIPSGAMVTRFAPSPTGFMHIGGIYAALINQRMAVQSNGIFYLRIEDTDTQRSQDELTHLIVTMLNQFHLSPHEGLILNEMNQYEMKGEYGPYTQSQRRSIYRSYVLELVKKGLAYPCFLTNEELEKIRSEQVKSKQKPGCYGRWAKWRSADSKLIEEKLAEGASFVIRLKAPGNARNRMSWKDLIKGTISMPENDIDIVLLKSDGLPTYHFAHVVDDHLMRTTHVIRGDEWLSSVPLHLQLFQLLNLQAPAYAHIAPIEKEEHVDGSISRRKLSKRKDAEANILFYLQSGFPEEAILQYLLNLMDSSFLDWQAANQQSIERFMFSLEKLSKHGALSDIAKLKSISKDVIAQFDINLLYQKALAWAEEYDKELAGLMKLYPDFTQQVLNIEREGDRPCKRFTTFEDIKSQLHFMYDEYFNQLTEFPFPVNVSASDASLILTDFIDQYDTVWDKQEWLTYLKAVSMKYGYADSMKVYKQNPSQFKGNFSDVAMLLRVALCGTTQTPDLWETMRVLGKDKAGQRLAAAIKRLS